MTRKQQQDYHKPPNQQTKPTPVVTQKAEDKSLQQPKDGNQIDQEKYIKEKPYNITIEQKNDSATKTIAIVSIIVNVILVGITFMLYTQASRQSTATVGYLQEMQNEFQVENKPFLQVVNVKFDTLEANKPIVIGYVYTNFGKQPIKCLTGHLAVMTSKDENNSDYSNLKWNNQIFNTYISGQAYYDNTWRSEVPFSAAEVNLIKDGKEFVLFFGKVFFINTVTNEKSMYEYTYRLRYVKHSYSTDGIVDTTTNIK